MSYQFVGYNFPPLTLSLSLLLFVFLYINECVCVCVCFILYTRCDWSTQKLISLLNYKFLSFLFKVISQNSFTLSHTSMPRFNALLRRILLGYPSASSLRLSWFQNESPWRSQWAWRWKKKKKDTQCKTRWIREYFQYNNILFGQGWMHWTLRAGALSWWRSHSYLFSRTELQDFFVDLQTHCLALW